jgi:hypothetical protein
MVKALWIEREFAYDGTQLHSLFAYMDHGILGDSIVAWRGACAIPFEHMLDGEDVRAQSPICGDLMLHFIIEKFAIGLWGAVALQRLTASLCADLLRERVSDLSLSESICRDGDDVFSGSRKFSISIATQTPTSSLIHFAVNIVNTGTPVATCALSDFAIDPREFGEELMKRVVNECLTMTEATQKVHWAK